MHMKKSLVIAGLALMGAAVQSYGAVSGVVLADNYGTGAGTISDASGLAPATAYVEVWAGAVGGAQSLIASGNLVEPGFFDLGAAVIPGVAGGGTASFTVKAWEGATSYDAATLKGTASWQQSSLGSFDDSIQPPPVKQGPELNMPAITIGAGTPVIPEPTTIALGLLGAAALFIRRRS